ncbi:MAG: ATP-binding cassette domain-containing protein, partial [Corynebacterium kroppenstedtii]|nr:ATP-binding cassette domain-containing protein [Corynebacterium kroppenstedtii]
GQRRRLIVARALLSDSSILLLDEPTEHVDKDSEKLLLDALGFGSSGSSMAMERTIVMVRHPRS